MGSSARLILRIASSESARSFLKYGALVIETPCSPLTVPPSAKTASKTSAFAFSAFSQMSGSVGFMMNLV